MAVLNYSGLLLAGKRVFQDIDQYEDDDADILDDEKTGGIDKKASYLYFKPLNEWETKKDWNVKMLEDESIECIASGSGWCACVTDKNWLRIFSQDGVQKQGQAIEISVQGPYSLVDHLLMAALLPGGIYTFYGFNRLQVQVD